MVYIHDTITFIHMGQQLPMPELILVYVLTIWSLIWKGIALWRAAKLGQRNWYIVILVLNTIGILDIIYLFRFAKHRLTIKEIKDWLSKTFTKKVSE